jgi:hypothetical protein
MVVNVFLGPNIMVLSSQHLWINPLWVGCTVNVHMASLELLVKLRMKSVIQIKYPLFFIQLDIVSIRVPVLTMTTMIGFVNVIALLAIKVLLESIVSLR